MPKDIGYRNTFEMSALIVRKVAAFAALACLAAVQPSAEAGIYQALCEGGSECTVTLSNGKLITPGSTIPKERILSWSQGGSGTKTDVGIGVASVVMFGLPGIIGFGAKKHDYLYSVDYVTDTGNVQVSSIQFKNNTPANQFMMELMGMTGLTAGEQNKTLSAEIEKIKAESAEKARIAALDCASVLKPYGCSYSKYLESNPGPKAWATKFPQMVPAEKAKLRAID